MRRPSARRSSAPAPSPLYRLTWWVGAISLRLFYRRVEARDVENFPADGPVLLVANHPNYMVDPLVVGAARRRQVHFVAKGPLLDRYPVLSRFLRAVGCVPVYRPQDDPQRHHDNAEAIRHGAALLGEGRALCIFAEGESHARPRVDALHAGAAHLALEAEAQHGYELGLHVVPVGIYFPHPERFFSDGITVFGPPIDLAPFITEHRRSRWRAVYRLTRAIETELRRIALHVPDLDWVDFVEQARDLTLDQIEEERGGPVDAATHLQVSHAIVRAVAGVERDDPARAEQIREQTADAWRRVEAVRRHRPRRPAGLGWAHRFRDAAALPLAIGGAALNLPPYLFARAWARAFVQRREKAAFVKFLVGAPAFAAWYGFLAGRIARGPRAIRLIAMLATPLAGILSLRAERHGRRWWTAWRALGGTPDAALVTEARTERDRAVAALREAALREAAPSGAEPSADAASPDAGRRSASPIEDATTHGTVPGAPGVQPPA